MQIDPTLTEIVSCAAPSAQEVAKGVGSGYISWSLLASATLHGGALALAVFGYDIGHREKASMAGKQTVMQLQWVNVPASDPSEAVEFEFTPSSMLPEVAQEREPLEQKEPVKETESSDAAFDYVQSSAELPTIGLTAIDVFQTPPIERRSLPELSPEPPQLNQPLTRQQLARQSVAQLALAPQLATIPQVLGTDSSEPPKLDGNAPPVYPESAYRARIQGTVWLKLHITAEGKIDRVEIERSSGHAILDEEALRTIRTWKAQPARRNGEPIETEEILPVRFAFD